MSFLLIKVLQKPWELRSSKHASKDEHSKSEDARATTVQPSLPSKEGRICQGWLNRKETCHVQNKGRLCSILLRIKVGLFFTQAQFLEKT